MNHEEYLALYRVEKDHWFYTGKREIVLRWIEKFKGELSEKDVIVDAGAGTGQLILELKSSPVTRKSEVIGIEYESEPRRIARELNNLDLRPGSILDLPIETNTTSVSIALDVLEHVEDDARALNELVRITQPDGLVLINVPAFPSLWSAWDVSLGHHRRYTLTSLKRVLERDTRHEVLYLGYNNSVIFPLVWIYRKFAKLLPRVGRMEDSTPPKFLNRLLRTLYVTPAIAGLKLPFGVSIFAVLKKK